MDYEKDIKIDESSLDVEWLDQGSLGIRYCQHESLMKKKERWASEKVKTTRSELILQCNEDPMKALNKAKPNAGDIEAYYRSNLAYKAAKEEWINAVEEAEFAELARWEICYNRRTALENLVVLHGQMYFAGPKVPRNLTNEWQKKQSQSRVDKGISQKLKRGEPKK